MRLLESRDPKLLGVILVAAAYTDLGDEDEARSEYFNRPWDWETMREGAEYIVLFHGTDDHLIPVGEARYIASKMNDANHFTFIEMDNKSHFFRPWQEILDVFDDKFGNGYMAK
jgi:predicted alpha/beta hydrolase family esterase